MLTLPIEINWNRDERRWYLELENEEGCPKLSARTPTALLIFLRARNLIPRETDLEKVSEVDRMWRIVYRKIDYPCVSSCCQPRHNPEATDYNDTDYPPPKDMCCYEQPRI